jgi:hypothetical protein
MHNIEDIKFVVKSSVVELVEDLHPHSDRNERDRFGDGFAVEDHFCEASVARVRVENVLLKRLIKRS